MVQAAEHRRRTDAIARRQFMPVDAGRNLGLGWLPPSPAGNQTEYVPNGAPVAKYDVENRITETTLSGAPVSQAWYDGEGRRIKKRVGGVATVYVYGAGGELMAEYEPEAPAGSVALAVRYPVVDHLGSTRVLLDGSGEVEAGSRVDYAPFGGELGRSGVEGYGGTTLSTLKFTGKERDAETGLDYFGARYMSSAQGRWTSPDAINVTKARMINPSSTLNKYAYAANNPLQFVDPDGKDITIYYRESRGVLTGDFGHIFIGALNQDTGQVRFLDYYQMEGKWPRGEINGNMTEDRLRAHGSITIQTSPADAQKVIDQIDQLAKNVPDYTLSARLDPGNFGPTGLACTVLCENVLAEIGIDLGGHYLPWSVWQNAYYKYGEGSWLSQWTHRYRSEGSAAPYGPNKEFGSPRWQVDMYWLMHRLYWNRNAPEPKGCVAVSDSATGTSSKSCE